MRVSQGLNTYIDLREENGDVRNIMLFIYGSTGSGKTTSTESIVEEFHKLGYTILILADPKDEFEFGFAMFEPRAEYHLQELRKIGKQPSTKKVNIYHPFTFDIPTNKKLPEIRFYGFSIKELKREEWSLIAETASESDTIRMLLNASSLIGNNDGLFSFVNNIRERIMGNKGKKNIKTDPKNFYLDVSSATAKSLVDISSYLLPFKYDYFLLDNNSPLRLDWKEILNDNEPYHFFTTYWLQDEKMKQLCVATLFNSIIRNKRFAKRPLLIVIPEIRRLTPFKPEGYKKFLAETIKNNLSVMRSQGRGMSGIFDSQVWGDVDEDVRASASDNLYGQFGSPSDIEKLAKALSYRRDYKDLLKEMPRPATYLWQKNEKFDTFTCWMPSHCHKEEKYNFEEMYARHFPEKMKDYTELYEQMEEHFENEDNKVKKIVEKRIREIKELEERKRKIREKSKSGEDVEKLQEEIGKFKNIAIEEKAKSVYLYKKQNPDATWRDVAKAMSSPEKKMHHNTAKIYYEKYEAKINSQEVINMEEDEEPEDEEEVEDNEDIE